MDWNLLVAILGIIVCSFAAFMVGFCAGSSIGQLREHERVSQAIDGLLKRLEAGMEIAATLKREPKEPQTEEAFANGMEVGRVMESRDA